jgi:membrane protein DedA with SNARE-associated domain
MVGAGYWGGSTLDMIKNNVSHAHYGLVILASIAVVAIVIWRVAAKKLRTDNDEGGGA